MSFDTANIRNVAFAGHGGTGKTSIFEQILFNGGAIAKAEKVDTGRTASDYTDEEIEKKLSIYSSLGNITWNNTCINLLDTPGSADFVGEVLAPFRATETAVMVVGASAGVQIETIKLWRKLNELNMPRMLFINMMDKERANFETVFEDIKGRFEGVTFVPVTIPMGNAENFKGIVNLIEGKAYLADDDGKKAKASDIPADMADAVEEYNLALIEAAAEGDDELMEKYFEESTLSADEIRLGLKAGLANNAVVPVLCGSAELNSGISSLLNFITNIGPSPSTAKETTLTEEGEEAEVAIDSSKPFSALVFKTSIDQFSGKLSYLKVVTGKIGNDSELYNLREGKREKVSKVYRCLGKKLVDAKELVAGDIGVITKMDSVSTNDTLNNSGKGTPYAPLKLPQPVHAVTVNAVTKKDEDKLNQFLNKAAVEDLTFSLTYDKETKETVIAGMGELHINMVLDRIRDKQKVEMETKVPRVAYRETITKPAEAEYTHKKQSGGHGQFGRVVMKITPIPQEEYMTFENVIRGMAISKNYMPGIKKGIVEAMEEGFLAKYPMVGIGTQIVDGKEHPVDSSEMAFKLAGKGALRAALDKAGVVLLEPVMNLKVYVDDQYLGDVLSDLSTRRGRVQGQDAIGGGMTEVNAQVPQAELMRYTIDLKSITSGTAAFEMEFNHYSPVQGKIADDVIAASKREEA